MSRRGRVPAGLLVLVVILVVVGCNASAPVADQDPLPPTTPVTTPSPGAAQTEDPEEAAVRAAYEGYWRAILAANDPPDQFHPDLARYATGEAFESVFQAAQANRLTGRILRLPENSITEYRIDEVDIDGDSAQVWGCTIDDGLVIDAETGDVLDDDIVTFRVSATLTRENGTWKVSHSESEESWEGVAGCALE